MSWNCLKCGKELSPETTGLYPFWNGYICGVCYDKAGEEFCKAVAEFEATPVSEADIDRIIDMLKNCK